MLVVPKSNVTRLQPKRPEIDPIYLALAAADMHEQGRLFEPDAKDERVKGILNDIQNDLKELREKNPREQPTIPPEINDRDNGSAGTKRTG